MGVPYPSLDEYIRDPGLKAAAIWADYQVTNKSQSVLNKDLISSMPYDVQQAAGQWERITDLMSSSLNRLYGAYFDECHFDVTIDDTDTSRGTDVVVVKVSGILIEDNVRYNLNKLLSVNSQKIISVSDFTA